MCMCVCVCVRVCVCIYIYIHIYIHIYKVNKSHYRPEVPRSLKEVKVPRLRNNGPGWW